MIKKIMLIYYFNILMFLVGLFYLSLGFALFLGSIGGLFTRGYYDKNHRILYVVEDMIRLIIYVMLQCGVKYLHCLYLGFMGFGTISCIASIVTTTHPP